MSPIRPRTASGKALGTITRPDFELGGTPDVARQWAISIHFLRLRRPRDLTLPRPLRSPVDGNRDLTAFNLGTNYAGTTFNFVPEWLASYRHPRCNPHRELQHLPRPIGVPRRLCPRHGDVRPLPPTAKRRSHAPAIRWISK